MSLAASCWRRSTAGAEGLAGEPLRVRRVADLPDQQRLSRRARGALLQRPASLRPCRGRGPLRRAHRLDFLQEQAYRRASAHERQPQAHDGAGAHGLQSSALRRLTIERIRKDAAMIGPATAALCELILDVRRVCAHRQRSDRASCPIVDGISAGQRQAATRRS